MDGLEDKLSAILSDPEAMGKISDMAKSLFGGGEEDGHARFPDAPTERGVKHLEELIRCQAEGYEAAVCFVIQMAGMKDFAPNDVTHPAFGAALRKAAGAGVQVLARGCSVTPDTLTIAEPVKVCL